MSKPPIRRTRIPRAIRSSVKTAATLVAFAHLLPSSPRGDGVPLQPGVFANFCLSPASNTQGCALAHHDQAMLRAHALSQAFWGRILIWERVCVQTPSTVDCGLSRPVIEGPGPVLSRWSRLAGFGRAESRGPLSAARWSRLYEAGVSAGGARRAGALDYPADCDRPAKSSGGRRGADVAQAGVFWDRQVESPWAPG